MTPRLQAFAVVRLSDILSRDYGERVTVSLYVEEFRATFARPASAAAFAEAHKLKTRGALVVCLTHALIKKILDGEKTRV